MYCPLNMSMAAALLTFTIGDVFLLANTTVQFN